MKRTVIYLLFLVNIYFISHIFIGENSIFNYLKYKAEIEEIEKKHHNLMKERYKLENLSILLSKTNEENDDVLDELLRQLVQASLPNEKIVLLKKE